ncbi:MAG: hypothetical protein GYB67_13710 [Chloroflexi bacterium]|nr:hypothetical protein [Chloroflexota bacterium]
MSETQYDLARDLNEAAAMAAGLQPYVLGDRLYGNVGSGGMLARPDMPSLTIGALLMRLRRLNILSDQLTAAQRDQLTASAAQVEQVRSEWTVHYQEKLMHEGASRLKAIQAFFAECKDDPQLCANVYLPEALRRTIVQEIIVVLATYGLPGDELLSFSRKIDGELRRYTQPAPFIWAEQLAPVYPEPAYWWLYARPPQTYGQPNVDDDE